jgi:hypothetical protein
LEEKPGSPPQSENLGLPELVNEDRTIRLVDRAYRDPDSRPKKTIFD